MRKSIVILMALVVAVAGLAGPAAAGKKKKVHDSFGASLLPLPNISSYTGTERPGCTAGQEGVHWVAQEFTSPGKGDLRFYMEGFTGDHDIYVFAPDSNVPLARGDQAQVGPELAPPQEEIVLPLTKGQKVVLVACNWFGHPEVEAHYEGTFK